MTTSWVGRSIDVRIGGAAHGGFCIARHDGRVMFVRHALPGELVRALVTEDQGKSFCRADAVEVIEASAHRIAPLCPISGPGGSGCCDFSHTTPAHLRSIKADIVAEQLTRIAGIEREILVEELPGSADGTHWRSRVRLAVDDRGQAGFRRFRSSHIVTDPSCPQGVAGLLDGIGDSSWTPDSDLHVVMDSDGVRHIVESSPVTRTGGTARAHGRRGASSRRASASGDRRTRVRGGTGRATEQVGSRTWELDATGFWQAHVGAATTYSDVVGEWAGVRGGDTAWDLYCGVGVFAARLASGVGADGQIVGAEFSARAVQDGRAALGDLPTVTLLSARVERSFERLTGNPSVVVLDPPRSGAGRDVVAGVAASSPERIVHVGCDPAAFARDAGLYRDNGYTLADMRAFDAFPLTHHVEVIGLFVR